jgi:LytS/YehU family sensor histidine kinase
MKNHLQAQAEPFSPFDGTEDTVVDFLRRRLPMTLAINTIIALLIALLLHSWDEVIPNLVIAYCIGLSILALVAAVRCTVMQRFRGRIQMRFAIYFVLIVAGAIGGELLSKLFLPRQSPTYTMHESYIWLVAIVFSLVAGSIALFINFSWVRLAQSRRDVERAERAAIEAQLRALQAQIEPHFLFNTLASIDQLIQTDAPRASRMQQSLIRYLRSAMPQMREGSRPSLGQQVDLCGAFLEIMAVRMEGRLQPVVRIPEGLRSAVFPSMMLQTLVENAIKHGLEPKPDGGRLEIGAEVGDGQLAVHVLDTGLGFMPKGEGGVGLANVRERLKALYQGRAELIIGVPPAGGTCATIKVPYEIAPA